jgi:carboxyl-terminal processing protease
VKSRGLALALIGAMLLGPRAEAQTSTNYEELQAFSTVLNYVRLNYTDSVVYRQMVRAAINGVLGSLDPHSYFMAADDYRRLSALERGELAVTGLTMELVDGRATVLTVVDKSPADRAGIDPGDRLLAIDDSTTQGQGIEDLKLRLAGEKGSRVRVRFARGPILEPDSFSVTLKREMVVVPVVDVATMVDSITGLVHLAEFTETSAREVERAIHDLRGRHMRRLILDLRGNPGGLMIQAVDIASLFFPKRTVVFRTHGRRAETDAEVMTHEDGAYRDLPLIVLIDGGSASASEALTGSLQDHDRALIVGRRSFGKALMQVPFFLQTGDVLVLTVGRVLTPGGRFIQRRYEGLTSGQYWALSGRTGAAEDTAKVFYTNAGRVVRGGGGIAPDLEVAGPAPLPAWLGPAADSGWDTAVADSVAQTLPATSAGLARWSVDTASWRAQLLPPFLARVRAGLRVTARSEPEVLDRIARGLARRAAKVRWGDAGELAFRLRNDQDLQAAISSFPRLSALLAPTRP